MNVAAYLTETQEVFHLWVSVPGTQPVIDETLHFTFKYMVQVYEIIKSLSNKFSRDNSEEVLRHFCGGECSYLNYPMEKRRQGSTKELQFTTIILSISITLIAAPNADSATLLLSNMLGMFSSNCSKPWRHWILRKNRNII